MLSVLLCRMTLRAGSELHHHLFECSYCSIFVASSKWFHWYWGRRKTWAVLGLFVPLLIVDKTCHSVQLSSVPSNLPLMTSRRKKSTFNPLCLFQDGMNFIGNLKSELIHTWDKYEHQRRKQWTKSSSSLTLYQCFYNEQLYTMLDQAAESSDA